MRAVVAEASSEEGEATDVAPSLGRSSSGSLSELNRRAVSDNLTSSLGRVQRLGQRPTTEGDLTARRYLVDGVELTMPVGLVLVVCFSLPFLTKCLSAFCCVLSSLFLQVRRRGRSDSGWPEEAVAQESEMHHVSQDDLLKVIVFFFV